MDNRSAHDQPFLPDQTCRRNARRHILWRDHFAHHSTRRISGCHKDGAEIEPAGRDDLQVAEKRVTGSVAPAQEAGNPAEEHREEGEDGAYRSDRETQRIDHARVVIEVGQSKDQNNRQDRETKLLPGVRQREEKQARADSEKYAGEHNSDQDSCARA